jgi:hypothetical protein
MGWQLDGTFLRINPDYSASASGALWYKDLSSTPPIKIVATRHDYHDNDLALGIQACLNLDGLNAMRADLNMAGYDLYAKDGIFTGNISSLGIDDNATSNRLRLSDDSVTVGGGATTSTTVLRSTSFQGMFEIQGGGLLTTNEGAHMRLFADSHPIQPNDIEFLSDGDVLEGRFDKTNGKWDFIGNNITTTGVFTGDGSGLTNLAISGYLKTDGTEPLTANWAVGGFDITGVSELGCTGEVHAGNSLLAVQDQFYMGAPSLSAPTIYFDSTDFIQYNRASDQFSFWIGGSLIFGLEASVADFGSVGVTTTGVFTGDGSGLTNVPAGTPEGTDILSTGETVGKVLQADGDNTCSWVTLPGGGDALTTNPLSQFAQTTIAQLNATLSDGDVATTANVLELDNTDVFVPDADYEPATKKYVDDNSGGSPEGTAVLSTGVPVGRVLQADGDNTSSWVALAGGGDLKADGTVPLTANWDVGAFDITAQGFVGGTDGYTVGFNTGGIRHATSTGYVFVAGGTGELDGATMSLYGGSHATVASDVKFASGLFTSLYYDRSAKLWDFQENAITTTGTVNGSNLSYQGRQTMWVPAAAMRPTVSNGCAALADAETTAGNPDITGLAFDAAADEHAQFSVEMPKSWDAGTITFQASWESAAADTDGVAIALQGVAISDGDTYDVSYGTAIVVTDAAQSTPEDRYVTPESGAVTIAGSPANSDVVMFRIFRDVSDAADTAVEDMVLTGIRIFYTTDAGNDA